MLRKISFRRPKKMFRKNEQGSVAIEFAMLFPLFTAMMFSICEAALFHYKTSAMEEAVSRASRMIRTGQAITATDPTAQDACTVEKDCFFDEICAVVDSFGNCDTALSVDVTRFSSWTELNSDLSAMTCPTEDGYSYSEQGFDRGDQLDIIRVRACFIMETVNPALGLNLSKTPDGRRALISTYVFRNEPYSEGLDDEERPS